MIVRAAYSRVNIERADSVSVATTQAECVRYSRVNICPLKLGPPSGLVQVSRSPGRRGFGVFELQKNVGLEDLSKGGRG